MTTETAEDGDGDKPKPKVHPIDEDIRRLVFDQIGKGKKIGVAERRHMQTLAAQWQIARNLGLIGELIAFQCAQSINNTRALVQALGKDVILRADRGGKE